MDRGRCATHSFGRSVGFGSRKKIHRTGGAPTAVWSAAHSRTRPISSSVFAFSHHALLIFWRWPAEAMWRRNGQRSWKAAARLCVMVGAACAVLTATLGWCDAAFTNYTGAAAPILLWHRWIGTSTAAWAVITAVVSELAHRRSGTRWLQRSFLGLLIGGIVLVGAAGYLGASLIYGLNHFRW